MRRLFVAIFAVLTIAVAGAGSAFAANPTWLPAPESISPNTSLYVSPEMQKRLNIDETALAQKISEQEARNGLHFRVVITQQGDDLSDATKSTWASDIEHNVLWNNFQTAGNFDESHTVLLLYIRSKSDNSGSIAARSGSYLHSLNIGQEQFADNNGPVLSAARRYIRSDVPAAVVAILSNINDAVTTAQAAASPAADQPQTATGTPASDDNSGVVALVVFGGIAVVVLVIVLMVRASNRRDRERRERLASLSSQARSERPSSYTPPSYTPPTRRSSPPPRRSSGGSSSGRRSSGGGIFIGGFPSSGGSHHSSGGSRSSCGSSSSGSSSSSSCGSSSSSSSCGSSSSSSCGGGSSSSCGGGGSV